MSTTYLPYDEVSAVFDERGSVAALDHMIALLKAAGDFHAMFRIMLLKKRYELKLPLINPGDLKNIPADIRKEYEDHASQCCRQIGELYLKEHNIAEAWRYYRTLGEHEPVRDALEKLKPEYVNDEILQVALDQGVHPKRGFELLLERNGLCRAITVFDVEFTTDLEIKKYAAGLLVRRLYDELVQAVKSEIHGKFGDFPPENDLIELIRSRPWLFEHGNTHADAQHIAAVARIGLLCDAREDLIKTLAIAEYGRMLDLSFQLSFRAPFTEGFDDCALFARALLGQNVEGAAETFRRRVANSDVSAGSGPAELLVLLLWRNNRKMEALVAFEQHLPDQPRDLPGLYLPPFNELCVQAGELQRLSDAARNIGDFAVFAASNMHRINDTQAAEVAVPKKEATPAPASDDLS